MTLLITTSAPDRGAAALTLACANAALGAATTAFFDERAVVLLAAATSPVADLVAQARDLSVVIVACQTGLAAERLGQGDLIDGVQTGGLIGLLATLGEARLATF